MTPLTRCARRHKALGNPTRLRVLAMLEGGDLCACQVIAVLRLAPSTVSRHLAELRAADLVTERKEGRWVHYSLATGPDVEAWLEPVRRALADDPQIRDDRNTVRRLHAVPVEVLCEAGRDVTRLKGVSEVSRA